MYLKWAVPQIFVDSPEVEYRNTYFRNLAKMTTAEVAIRCTELSVDQMGELISLARTKGGVTFQGTGLEAGAGCGLLSAVTAKEPGVQRMYALEACEEAARLVIPKIAGDVLGDRGSVVVPVFGTFDDIELEDNSLDFMVEIHSYHHSHNLPQTCREAARVLKPGGFLVCFDRCQPNTLSDEEVQKMLAKVYDKAFLSNNCYPTDVVLTRAENGEHEYRQFEWEAAFVNAGLTIEKHIKFERAIGLGNPIRALLKMLPVPAFRKRFSYAQASDIGKWFGQTFGGLNVAPRKTTMFVLRKPA